MKKKKTTRTARPVVLVISENESFTGTMQRALRNCRCRCVPASTLGEAFDTLREQDVAAAIVDTIVQYVPGSEIADALRGVSKRLKCVALRDRQVGRPPKQTSGGSIVMTTDTPAREIAAVAAKPGRGRRKASADVPDELLKLLDDPLCVSRKVFLDAADTFYLQAAIEVASIKPRLAAAIAGDSVASAYRLLDEYGIPYGLAAGASPCRRKKAKPRRRRRRKRAAKK